jgi:hypothetical protein
MQMQRVTEPHQPMSVAGVNVAEASAAAQSASPDCRIIRRTGGETNFGSHNISVATIDAFLAIGDGASAVAADKRNVFVALPERLLMTSPRHQHGPDFRKFESTHGAGIGRRHAWGS